VLAAGVAALSLAVAVAPASAGKNGPNNVNAKMCQSYLDWVRADGSAFASSDECTSYAARGGQLAAKPPALSAGCTALNDPVYDQPAASGGPEPAPFNAGETITVTASNPGAGQVGVVFIVDEVQQFAFTFPATLTYTFPSSGTSAVSWLTLSIGAVDFQVSCGR
jgi:hypothetical protein